jgi:dihydroorotate dehydrogenase electron transfer subunit
MIDTLAIVERNDEIAPNYRLLTLQFDQDIAALPGQFAMLKAHNAIEPLLRRALAVYGVQGARRLSFLYQILGRGTEALSQVKEGGTVDALIPLGNSWQIEPTRKAVVVAGGIGSASVLMLCERLLKSKIDTSLFFGAASETAAIGCGLNDFRALDIPITLTTDDGSLGERGFVTAPLERYLHDLDAAGTTIYSCGPWVMMKRVAELASEFGVRCVVSLEAPMGCGFGVCVGCVVAIKTDGPLGYGSYKRVCIDGSIFPAEQIRWDVNAMTH